MLLPKKNYRLFFLLLFTSVGMLFFNDVDAKQYDSKFERVDARGTFIISAKAKGSINSGAVKKEKGHTSYIFEIDGDWLRLLQEVSQTDGTAAIHFKTTRMLKIIHSGKSCYNIKLKIFVSRPDGSNQDPETFDEEGCGPEITNGIKEQDYAIEIKPSWVDNMNAGDSLVVEVRGTVFADPGSNRQDRAEVSWQIKLGTAPKLRIRTVK